MTTRDAATAARRFGLGPKPGDLSRIAGDPRGSLLAALKEPVAALIDDSVLQPSHTLFVDISKTQRTIAEARRQKPADPGAMPAGAPDPDAARIGPVVRDIMIAEATARLDRALATPHPVVERLVMFWSNHFCVSAAKGPIMRAIAGAFEREAIRPHVLGRFADMLKAVEQHPAMLIYLDNQISLGPNSKAGQRRNRGLNENLAREILELHTLGVDGGYTQTDVTNLARIITGWTVGRLDAPPDRAGRFVFADAFHEPGRWQVMGKTYAQDGVGAGEAVLADLARHPATARHIAGKFARHFIGDAAPDSVVTALAQTFREKDGDLGALARTLVTAQQSWTSPAAKVLPPWDFLVAIQRGLGVEAKPAEMLRLSAALGQPLWQVPSPKGWPDADESWMGPSAIRERLRIAERAARDMPAAADPRTFAADLLGPSASIHTTQAIARAESRTQGFELLIMSPEFQRR